MKIRDLLVMVQKAMALLVSVIQVTEEDGVSGADKRAAAIERARDLLNAAQQIGELPAWLVAILSNAAVLGLLIDFLVGVANRSGFFASAATSP
jgi:hypothetical protein